MAVVNKNIAYLRYVLLNFPNICVYEPFSLFRFGEFTLEVCSGVLNTSCIFV